MLKVVHDVSVPNDNIEWRGSSLLDGIVRNGARRMLAAALQAEVAAYIEAHGSTRTNSSNDPLTSELIKSRVAGRSIGFEYSSREQREGGYACGLKLTVKEDLLC